MAERDITVNINGNGSGGTSTPPTPPEPPASGGDTRLSASVSDLVSELRSVLSQGGGPAFGQSGFKGYLDDDAESIITNQQPIRLGS